MYTELDLKYWTNNDHKFYYLYGICHDKFQLCNNFKILRYKDYGGRGIEFRFKSLIEMGLYILNTLGERPEGLTLDRIDNNSHYGPGNLRWATRSEQELNKRNNVKYPYIYFNDYFSKPWKVIIKEIGTGNYLFYQSCLNLSEAIKLRDKFLLDTDDPRYFSIYPEKINL